MALLEDWLRRPAQKSVSTDQLKVFFDLFAMEALSQAPRGVTLCADRHPHSLGVDVGRGMVCHVHKGMQDRKEGSEG